MIYDLSNPLHYESFKIKCNNLAKKRGIVELTDKRKRTIQQNSYLHLILSYFGCETGNTLEYVKKEYYKSLCNAELYSSKKIDPYKGEIEVLKSSRELTKDEMTLSIERFKKWSVEVAGVYLPDAEQSDMITQMEIEIERNKKYL